MNPKRSSPPSGGRGQLELDLRAERANFRRDNYVVSDSNAPCVDIVAGFLKGDQSGLVISGPEASGKTHLCSVIALNAGVKVASPHALPATHGRASLFVLDDAHAAAPRDLLSLVESVRAGGGKVILAGCGEPVAWAGGLRDLETRLAGFARASLPEPDEELLAAVIRRQFETRQWRAGARVAQYAAPRIARTFAAASQFVEAAGAAAIARQKPISVPLAREVIENLYDAESAT